MVFDDVDDRIDLGNSFNNVSLPVTMMAWVQVGASNYNPIFSSSQHPSAYHGFWMNCGPNRVTAAIGDGTGGFTPNARNSKMANLNFNFTTNEWYHICAVIRGAGDMDIYVNGVDVGGSYNGTATTMANNPSGTASIGYHRRSIEEFYEGSIDEFKLFDKALSATEVRREMCRKADPSNPDLLAAWNFNEAGSTALSNDITNTYPGVQLGGPLTVLSGAAVGDTSSFSYPLTINGTLDLGLSNVDMVSAGVVNTLDGVQIYRVDNLPVDQDSIQTASGVNHYYGIFCTGTNNQYQVDYLLLAPFYQANSFELAYRKQNDSPHWNKFNAVLNPSFASGVNRLFREEYILIAASPCTGSSLLPNNYSACDSVEISLPPTYLNPVWWDGSNATNRTFYQSGSYILSGTDTNGCSISDTLLVQIQTAVYSPVPDQEFCDSVNIQLSNNIQAIQWYDGSINRQRYFYNPGNYWYRAQASNGCFFSDTFRLSPSDGNLDWNNVFRDLPEYCFGDTAKLYPPSGTQVIWPNNSDSSFTVYSSSSISVNLSAACKDTTMLFDIHFTDCECRVHIPNAFTPNGNGLNETFKPLSQCEFIDYHLIIFNRWGIKVFETTDPNQAFDGTYQGQAIPEGSLVYRLTYTSSRVQRAEQGIINLLR